MIRRLIAISALISLVSSFGISALAQNFGMSGSRGGGMGSSGFGSSGFGSGGMGGGGFGNSGFGGGGGFGNSGFGGGGMGGGGFGSSGFGGGGFGNSGFGGGNSAFGNSGFGNSSGYGMGGGQNFIGRDAADMEATFGQMGRAISSMNRGMNRNSNSNRRSSKAAVQNVAQPMRIDIKVAFNPPRLTSDQMASAVRTRLTRILAERQMSQPTFNMEGDTAVVGGVAASENERALIGQLLALEPGVRAVRNEMTVGLPAAAATDIAPAPGN